MGVMGAKDKSRAWRGLAARRRIPAACPHCGVTLIYGKPPPPAFRGRQATIDHILPRSLGGANASENLRVCCALCNETRALLGHCVGALACALASIGRLPPHRGRISATAPVHRAADEGRANRDVPGGGMNTPNRSIPPSELARHLYAEGDRHPAGSSERRAAYQEAAKAQQEADRLEANRLARQRRAKFRPAMAAETKNPAGQGRGFSGET